MPLGGMIRTAPKEIRDLDIGFYGGGIPNVSIEFAIQPLNNLMMHYDARLAIESKLRSRWISFLLNSAERTSTTLMNHFNNTILLPAG